jgi:hypothetical protein
MLRWSNRQAEGQVTKLKLVKRQGYGRAKVGMLRNRMHWAASSGLRRCLGRCTGIGTYDEWAWQRF